MMLRRCVRLEQAVLYGKIHNITYFNLGLWKTTNFVQAMDALQDQDPLQCGRRMCLRWGKNVKKSVKRGTGGVPIAPIRKKVMKAKKEISIDDKSKKRKIDGNDRVDYDTSCPNQASETRGAAYSNNNRDDEKPFAYTPALANASSPRYEPNKHSGDAIRVLFPSDPHRLKFITTVASFIAKDGSILERKLIEKESGNPKFSFLTGDSSVAMSDMSGVDVEKKRIEINERIFYRWRVYAFTQGDGFDSWRTAPFIMIQPNGRFWIPPSLDHEAAQREEEAAKQKEEAILAKMEIRKQLSGKKDFMTGRQLEHAKYGGGGPSAEGAAKLTEFEMEEFNDLLREKLCASREAICAAMAFCFDKSGAAKQISELLEEALLDDRPSVSVDTRIARLYLLSDVLFNSQQPGVKNAFRYRDAVEKMSPAVFESLGRHENGKAGRMTMNKLRNAVSAVLGAWTNWSVYNPSFLDHLYAKFEGKDVSTFDAKQVDSVEKDEEGEPSFTDKDNGKEEEGFEECKDEEGVEESKSTATQKPIGGWSDAEAIVSEEVDGEAIENEDIDGEELGDDDVDGEPLADDAYDGEVLDDVDGEELEDVDGEALDDADGEPL
mmetsp:Transcript_16472/g.47364  ORF Transcript_16472/g.47364 Transcript_16472/m.47364 type:complete len:605 (-) Transcript_16472:1189-3003(-)